MGCIASKEIVHAANDNNNDINIETELRAEIEKQRAELEEQRVEIQKLRAVNDNSANDINIETELRAEIEKQRAELEEQRVEIQKLRAVNDNSANDINIETELRAEVEKQRAEIETQRAEIETLREKQRADRENQRAVIETLRAEIETLRTPRSGAKSAWEPFGALLKASSLADVTGGDKLVMPAKYFLFGQAKAFMDGLPGMLTGGLLRSMFEEAHDNEGGKWLAEFEYVVHREAVEDVPDLSTTAKFKGKTSISGNIIVRDHGHGGMTLADFCSHEMARDAELTMAEVAALRLYSGPMYAPLNHALRTENISDWATTIACCYSGVLKLSFLSQPARVYRGVKEDEMQLPDEFLNREEGQFAGGVERAFMSTTKSAAVALDYSGGGAASGSIFVIDFDKHSRGASIQFLSQYPHEEELLFPPCTGLACLDVSQHGRKRCVLVSAQVSTARFDTREVTTPTHVPGTEVALQWAAELFDCSVKEVVDKEEWDLERRNLSSVEHAQRLALLLGRASTMVAPRARSAMLHRCQLSPAGGAAIGEALAVNAVLTDLNLSCNNIRDEGAAAIAEALRANEVLTNLNLGRNKINSEGAKAIGDALAVNEVLIKLNLDGHELDLPKLRGTDPVTSLDLSRKELGTASTIVIASLIAGNAVLASLDVRDNEIGSTGAAAIAEALRGNEVLTKLNLDGQKLDLPKLRGTDPVASVDLSNKRLGPASAIVVASLIAGNEVLKTLYLGDNRIGGEGARALASALRVNEVLTTLDLSAPNTSQERHLLPNQYDRSSSGDIGPEGASAIAEALKVNGVLTSLNVGYNDLTQEAALDIVRVERQRNKLTLLGLARCQIHRTGAAEIAEYVSGSEVLETLILDDNYHNDVEGAKALASALCVNRVLKSLNLAFNNIRAEGAAAIAEALRGNGVLTDLNLAFNNIRAEGAAAIAQALRGSALTDLNLGRNGIRAEGAKAIGEALEVKNTVLTTLNLGDNTIRNEGAAAIAQALRGSALTDLDLSRNEIRVKGAQALASTLRANTVLNSLNVCCNNIGSTGATAIAGALEGNAGLKNIDLRGNNLGDNDKTTIRDAVGGRAGIKLEL